MNPHTKQSMLHSPTCGTPCATTTVAAWHARTTELLTKLMHASSCCERKQREKRTKAELGLCRGEGTNDWRCHFLHSRRHATRLRLPRLLQAAGYTGASVEVGVWKGDFSMWLLQQWSQGGPHFAVDPYASFSSGCNASLVKGGDKQCRHSQRTFDLVHNRTEARLRTSWPQRASLLRAFSVDGAKLFANKSLSFIYIDARHDYAGVLEDLAAWWPKLCDGGVLGGHDWTEDLDRNGGKWVAAALQDFLSSVDRMEESEGGVNQGLDSGQQRREYYVTSEHPASWFLFRRPASCTRR
jgi:hypothetical protein